MDPARVPDESSAPAPAPAPAPRGGSYQPAAGVGPAWVVDKRRPSVSAVLALQRAAGNAATRRWLARQARASLISALNKSLAAGDWGDVATRLNGFNDADIKRLARRMTRGQRAAVAEAAPEVMPGWSDRVVNTIQTVDKEAAAAGSVLHSYTVALKAGSWGDAALSLNGMADYDIESRVRSLNHAQRTELREAALTAMPGWAGRVTGVIDRLDAEAGRVGQVFSDFEAARREARWRDAARIANGFADGDIAVRLGRLSTDELRSLRAGAEQEMPGWAGRVTDAIDLLLDPEHRSHLQDATQHFENPAIQSLYDGNRLALGARRLAALHELDISLAGRWTQLQWRTVANSAAARVVDPTKIDQVALGVCAAAAALEADAEVNALEYARLVGHVFATGQVGEDAVNAKLLNSSPYQGMDQCDWMLLSAIQDTNNAVRDYPGHPTDHDPSGRPINVPVYRQGGYNPEGTGGGDEEKMLRNIDKCVQTRTIECHGPRVWAATPEVGGYLRTFPNDVVVLITNDGGLLDRATATDPYGTGTAHGHHDHVVRLLGPVTIAGDAVSFSVFSWGRPISLAWTTSRFESWVYEYVIGSRSASADIGA